MNEFSFICRAGSSWLSALPLASTKLSDGRSRKKMTRLQRILFFWLGASTLVACGVSGPARDAGALLDGGLTQNVDAGLLADAGPAGDAGAETDAGVPPDTDAGSSDGGLDAGNAADAGARPDGGPGTDAGIPDGGLRVRVVAANTSSGNNQSYDPGEGIRLFQALHPDIALVQEMNYATNSAADLQHFADLSFGAGFTVIRQTGAQIPNAVITRFPILASGVWTDAQVANRGFTWAHIDLPGPRDLWAISVHLLTSSSGSRAAEADEIMAKIGITVPAGDWIVLGGDFNTASRSEACVTKLSLRFSTVAPYPADRNGNANTSANRSAPHDWVLLNTELQPFEVPVELGAGNSFAHGLVLDTRVYVPLTQVAPALASDSSAPGMQHMPVAKDFLIPP